MAMAMAIALRQRAWNSRTGASGTVGTGCTCPGKRTVDAIFGENHGPSESSEQR